MTEVPSCQFWKLPHEHTTKPSGEFCEVVKHFIGETREPTDWRAYKKLHPWKPKEKPEE